MEQRPILAIGENAGVSLAEFLRAVLNVARELLDRLAPDVAYREVLLAFDPRETSLDIDSAATRSRRFQPDLRIVEVQPAIEQQRPNAGLYVSLAAWLAAISELRDER